MSLASTRTSESGRADHATISSGVRSAVVWLRSETDAVTYEVVPTSGTSCT